MATGLYRYITNRNNVYTVRIDKALGDNPAFGFTPAVEPMPDGLPRNMKMRSIGCHELNGAKYRRFPIGIPTATILTAVLPFSYKGVQYTLRWFKPERSRK